MSQKIKLYFVYLALQLLNIASINYIYLYFSEQTFNPVPFSIIFIVSALIYPWFNERLFKKMQVWLVGFSILITFVVGFLLVEITPIKFLFNFHKASNILSRLVRPNFSLFFPMLGSLMQTIYLALMATLLAIPFAFVISFFASRNLMPKNFIPNSIYYFTRTIFTFTRSIEAIVWAIIFTVWVGIGPFAGMLALWIHSIASLVKLYSEQIESIDHGPIEAMQATGANMIQIWIFAVIPQILSPFLAFTIYRWDINIRMATIVGFVGGGGIGQALQQQQQLLRWSNVSMIMLMIAVTVWIMDILSARIREYLLRK